MPWLNLLTEHRAIAVIRAPQYEIGLRMAQSVAAAGMRLIEITWDSDQPDRLIQTLRQQLPHCQIGAGTIVTLQDFQQAIDAGSQFLFSPYANLQVIHAANRAQIPIVPGALTPTEILNAWQAGANSVKVFPVSAMGNISYIRSLREPLREVALIPTGGVTIENASDFIQAGAIAVGLSTSLFPKAWVQDQAWNLITEHTRKLQQSLNLAKAPPVAQMELFIKKENANALV